MSEIECVLQSRDHFGESPVWSVAEQVLYWVDIKAPAIKSFDPVTQAHNVWHLPDEVGSIALRAAGGLVAATSVGFASMDPGTGHFSYLSLLPEQSPRTRFNDGKCDRAGRFWCGTLDDRTFAAIGTLFRFDSDHLPRAMASGFVLLNGMAWSPDNKTMYVADSRRETVYAYDFDIAEGQIANRRVHISTENTPGRVDGATVAQDGTYWCAHVRGGNVGQYDPDGDLIQTIPLPVRYPLMCTFGGRDLDILYVTSSLAMVTQDDADQQPLAGSLFAIYGCGSRGISEVGYAG